MAKKAFMQLVRLSMTAAVSMAFFWNYWVVVSVSWLLAEMGVCVGFGACSVGNRSRQPANVDGCRIICTGKL